MRLAGEGDLLARLEALRKQLRAEGLFELQKQLAPAACRARSASSRPRAAPPGATSSPGSSAGAGRARIVWGFAPVQDRRAAPAITAAIQDLAARPEVEAIVVTRGGGSLADLWAFCDETLCRTVAMLRVPVISAVGHERDTTLIDDVAAVACSTPTHAAEVAVPLDCRGARGDLERRAAAAARGPRRRPSAPALATSSPSPAARRGRCAASASRCNQKTREMRAASDAGAGGAGSGCQRPLALVLGSAPPAAPPGRTCGAATTRCAGRRSPSAPTTRSAPWSAATRWPRTPTASR